MTDFPHARHQIALRHLRLSVPRGCSVREGDLCQQLWPKSLALASSTVNARDQLRRRVFLRGALDSLHIELPSLAPVEAVGRVGVAEAEDGALVGADGRMLALVATMELISA